MKTLTLELPDSAQLDKLQTNKELLIFGLASTLYQKGILSAKEAIELTGESEQKFKEKMSEYDFVVIPNTDEDITLETDELKEKDEQPSKWALLAQRIKKENLLNGLGTELMASTKEFRENFHFKHDE